MRSLAFCMCTLSWVISTSAVGAEPAENASTPKAPTAASAEAKRKEPMPAWVRVDCAPRPVPEAERTAEGERKAMLGIQAILRTEKPIRYRTTTLPAGTYRVSVGTPESSGEGTGLVFIIRPEEAGGAGSVPKAEEPGAHSEKKKEMGTAESSAAGGRSPTGSAGPGGPSEGSETAKAKPAPGKGIRAAFRVVQAKGISQTLRLEARQNLKGDRFTLLVQAGGSQGKATIRCAAPATVLTE